MHIPHKKYSYLYSQSIFFYKLYWYLYFSDIWISPNIPICIHSEFFYLLHSGFEPGRVAFRVIVSPLVYDRVGCTLRSWVHPISMLLRTFSPGLEYIDLFQCSSDSFPHWPHISGCVQNCPNYISMYCCTPIAGRRSWKSVPNLSHSYVPFQDLLSVIGEQ